MLRKALTNKGKDRDKLVFYILFANREVPQASSGFSPFELLYGRSQGSSKKSSESVIFYVLFTQEKLREMSELVQENLTKAQGKQKHGIPESGNLCQGIQFLFYSPLPPVNCYPNSNWKDELPGGHA